VNKDLYIAYLAIHQYEYGRLASNVHLFDRRRGHLNLSLPITWHPFLSPLQHRAYNCSSSRLVVPCAVYFTTWCCRRSALSAV